MIPWKRVRQVVVIGASVYIIIKAWGFIIGLLVMVVAVLAAAAAAWWHFRKRS
jgi:hypothetical protein